MSAARKDWDCRGCHGKYGPLSAMEQRDQVHEFCRHTVYGKRQHRGIPFGHNAVTA